MKQHNPHDLTTYSQIELERAKELIDKLPISKLFPFGLAEIEMEIARRAPTQVAVVAPAEESQPSEESNN
jgi:hypothetical protein